MHLKSKFARTLVASALAAGVVAAPAAAAQHTQARPAGAGVTYSFETLDNAADPTFNQLLGINDHGLVAGYFGSGQPGHPNKGYLIGSPYGQASYVGENFPGSAQTQVTGLNNRGLTVGFWADSAGNNFPFYRANGVYHTVVFPASDYGSPLVSQFLGVNDHGIAVGFYTDANGNNHGFVYDIRRDRFQEVFVPGFMNITTTAINDSGYVAGFGNDMSGKVDSFLWHDGHVTTLSVPGAATTQALGVNNRDEVVGDYIDAQQQTHGFTWSRQRGFQTVDDPHGVGGTTINGVNDHGDLVGFYVDPAGNTDGLLAMP